MIRALGPAVLIDGADLIDLRLAIHARITHRRRNGVGVPTGAAEALVAFEAAIAATTTMSDDGHADVPEPDVPQHCITWIDADEAARRLGVTPRHIRRIAASLDGRRIAGRWAFPDDSIATYRHHET